MHRPLHSILMTIYNRRKAIALTAAAAIALAVVAALTVHGCSETDEQAPQVLQAEGVTDTTAMLVMQVQRCSRLYTTEWHIHKIVTHGDNLRLRGQLLGQSFNMDVPAGDRKIAMPIDAVVKGYVDLSLFGPDNVQRQGDRITVYLPDPEAVLTSTKIDQQAVKSYVSLARSRFTDEEMASYARQGRQAIVQSIPQLGIEAAARESAARLLVPMLVRLGYREENITITFRDDMQLHVRDGNAEHH